MNEETINTELEKETEEKLEAEKKQFEELLKDPAKVSEIIDNEIQYKKFKELFTENRDIKTAKCRRKSCGNKFFKVKKVEFCCKDCYDTYYKVRK